MFTVCPKCTLTLAVTAGDLRTGQGYVRCGRCSNVFNALLTLTEQPPDAAPAAPQAPAPAATTAQDVASAAAPASAPSPPSDVASSFQIDRILMLGGSAFPRPQAASAEGGAKPAPPRRAAPPTQAPARTAPASSPPGAMRAGSPPPGSAVRDKPVTNPPAASTASASVAAKRQVPNQDAARPPEPQRNKREEPAPKGSKAAPPSNIAHSAAPPPRQQSTRGREEVAPAAADEAELIEGKRHEESEMRTVETIVLEGDGFTQTEELVSDEQAGLAALRREIESLGDEGSAAPSGPRGAAAARASASAATARQVRSFRMPRRASAEDDESSEIESDHPPAAQPSEPQNEAPFGLDRQSAGYRRAWLWGSIALVVLLGVQMIDHWRDALAASPHLGAAVTRAYAALGVTLEPHWDLSAYEVRQQGAEADPKDSHVIHVRLSLANHASRAQPAPVLRLTLLDRYGKRIARRDLAPSEYWPRGHVRQSFLSVDQRIDSEVAVRDPNADSASFELDVCLRGGERLRCAMDSAPATANVLTP